MATDESVLNHSFGDNGITPDDIDNLLDEIEHHQHNKINALQRNTNEEERLKIEEERKRLEEEKLREEIKKREEERKRMELEMEKEEMRRRSQQPHDYRAWSSMPGC